MRQQDRVRAMARTLQRSASTIRRELRRNTVGALPYGSHLAQQARVVPAEKFESLYEPGR